MAAPPQPDPGEPLRRSHAALGRLRRLSRRRDARQTEQLLLVDGPVLLQDALAAGATVVEVFCEVGVGLPVVLPSGVPVRVVAPGELAKVLDLVTPRGVVAIVEQPTWTVRELLDAARRSFRPLVVGVEIQDPGNVGTLIRVAEAAGAAGVVLTVGSADAWGPKAVRAAAGSSLRVPVVVDADLEGLLDAVEGAGLGLAATVPVRGSTPEVLDLAGAFVLCVGNEARGLITEVVDRATERITIPMEGTVDSLNAAIAGSVVLFEAARQRRARDGRRSEVDGAP